MPVHHQQRLDPSQPIGLMRPIGRLEYHTNVFGRYEFLMALQIHYPDFWRSLKVSVVDHCEALDKEHELQIDKLFTDWANGIGVVDDWFLDACWQTLTGSWSGHPREWLFGPEHKAWFIYAPNEPVLPYFAPSLTDNRPLFTEALPLGDLAVQRMHDAITSMSDRETPEEFEARMREQFEAQLRAYSKFYKKRLRATVTMQTHAAWSVLIFSGKSATQIAKKWPGIDAKTKGGGFRYQQPEKAVRMAVKRFADEIGFTLPRVTGKRTKPSSLKVHVK